MNIWAIADLHLAFGVPEKTMELFGEPWIGYPEKIKTSWQQSVQPEDLVLIAGDISWSLKLEDARIDLEWIDGLPGIKVLIKGNHDYWWSSLSKVKSLLPSSLHLIQNSAFHYQNISIAGTRLWESDEYHFNEDPISLPKSQEDKKEQQKIFNRELERLERSLKELNMDADLRIAMTHYPPIGMDLKTSKASALLEKYGVNISVFGHLHHMQKGQPLFGTKCGISYYLTSADYLDFRPLKIF